MSAAASSPSSSTKRLDGKVALVTGGATGIGEAIVRLFREHGAKVCIADIQDEAGQQLRDALGDQDVMFVRCDVTIEDDVSRAVDAVVERFGALDVMVNNAGVTGSKVTDIRDVDLAEARRVLDVNVHGVFHGMKHAACSKGARADDALRGFLDFVGGEANLKGVDLMPRDVAEAVLFLASDEARYVSALNLMVDGGVTSVNNSRISSSC